MNASQKIVERVRATTETKTDYAVAKALGMPQHALTRVVRGQSNLGIEASFRAADLLRTDPAKLIAAVEQDRAPAEKKAFWKAHAAAIVAGLLLASHPVKQAVSAEARASDHVGALYIIRSTSIRAI